MAKGQGGFLRILMWGVIIVLIMLFVYGLVAPQDVDIPQGLKKGQIGKPYYDMLANIGIPTDWLYTPAIIYLLFVPLLGVILIAYGFLDSMQIFDNNTINVLLAIIFGVATIPFGVFSRIVGTLFALMGVYSTGAFVFLFVFGVITVVLDRLQGWGIKRTGTFIELQAEGKYNQLMTFFEGMYQQYSRSTSPAISGIVTTIPAMLANARDEFDNRKPEVAVRILRERGNVILGDLSKHVSDREAKQLRKRWKQIIR